jgi:hypothetical protein
MLVYILCPHYTAGHPELLDGSPLITQRTPHDCVKSYTTKVLYDMI